MRMMEVHDFARRFLEVHGDEAVAEAAKGALECQEQGDEEGAENWRRIRAALKEMRGPHVS